MELRYLFSADNLMMLYICTKFCESISKGIRVIDLYIRVDDRVVAIYKGGHNYAKTVDGVTVLILFTSSGVALYLYQVS